MMRELIWIGHVGYCDVEVSGGLTMIVGKIGQDGA